MSNRLVVGGSLAYDYISKYSSPFEDVLLPDKLHELSVCFVVHDKQRHFGGTAGNIAYNLALLDEPATILAGAGYDFEDYKKRLIKLKVDVSPIRISTDLPMASATIITDLNGHQIAEFHPGAMGKGLRPHTASISSASVLIIAPDDPTWMMEYVALAKHFEVPYFFDPGQGLPGFSKEQLILALTGAEGVFVNDYEYELLKKLMNLSDEALFDYVKLVIVTHGVKGSEIRSSGEVVSVPIVEPKSAADPTGCGDAYRAGFLKGILEKRDLKTCGQMGALLASYNVEQAGTQNHSFKFKHFAKRYLEMFKEDL